MVIDEYYDKAVEALRAEQKAFHGVMEAGSTMDANLLSDSIALANKAINRRTKALKDLVTVRDLKTLLLSVIRIWRRCGMKK